MPRVVPGLLYVVAAAAAASVAPLGGIVAAVGAVVPFEYFFTNPRGSFAVVDGEEAVALAVFVAVCLAVAQLVGREQVARRLAEAAADHAARLEALARALTGAVTPQDVIGAVLDRGLAAAEASAGVIVLATEDRRSLRVVAHHGYPPGRMALWEVFPVDGDLPASEAFRTGEPVFLETSAERDERYPALAGIRDPSHALVVLPLRTDTATIGALVLGFPSDQSFDEERRGFERAIASQVALALERTQLHEAQQRAEERLRLLADAGELLHASLDDEETLRRLAALVVPRIADWCVIDTLGDDGEFRRVAHAQADPRRAEWAEALAQRYRPRRDEQHGVARAVRTGEASWAPHVTAEQLETVEDEELRRVLAELPLRSSIVVPIPAGGRHVGALTLLSAESGRRLGEEDLELARELARRAGVALENARLYAEAERRADAARALRHVADGVLLVDAAGRLRFANAAAQALLDIAPQPDRRPARDAAPAFAGLARRVRALGASATLPVETAAGERWLRVAAVDFDEGSVWTLHDLTAEHQLEETRAAFVATASHELRTPLASVYGTLQTLLRPDISFSDGDRDRFLRMALAESERLTTIVEQMLLAGQLGAGGAGIDAVPVSLVAVAREVADSARMQWHAEGRIRVEAPEDPRALGDPARLRQVLVNLVENALKYAPADTPVAIRVGRHDGRAVLEVEDRGPGIPPGDRDRVFEKFVRLDPALRDGVGGTGLGLYITRELVARMGGRVSIHDGSGAGALVRVQLPLAA